MIRSHAHQRMHLHNNRNCIPGHIYLTGQSAGRPSSYTAHAAFLFFLFFVFFTSIFFSPFSWDAPTRLMPTSTASRRNAHYGHSLNFVLSFRSVVRHVAASEERLRRRINSFVSISVVLGFRATLFTSPLATNKRCGGARSDEFAFYRTVPSHSRLFFLHSFFLPVSLTRPLMRRHLRRVESPFGFLSRSSNLPTHDKAIGVAQTKQKQKNERRSCRVLLA